MRSLCCSRSGVKDRSTSVKYVNSGCAKTRVDWCSDWELCVGGTKQEKAASWQTTQRHGFRAHLRRPVGRLQSGWQFASPGSARCCTKTWFVCRPSPALTLSETFFFKKRSIFFPSSGEGAKQRQSASVLRCADGLLGVAAEATCFRVEGAGVLQIAWRTKQDGSCLTGRQARISICAARKSTRTSPHAAKDSDHEIEPPRLQWKGRWSIHVRMQK